MNQIYDTELKSNVKKFSFMVIILLIYFLICSADSKVIFRWDKYDLVRNPDVARLSLWEVTSNGLWISTINDFISPLDTNYIMPIPKRTAHDTIYYALTAVDSSENRSDLSNIVSITLKHDKVTNLRASIQ